MRPRVLSDLDAARICLGNQEAETFLALWGAYVHAIDDIVDGDTTSKESIIRAFAQAAVLYSSPFYRQHCDRLQLIVLLVTSTYADSVHWEGSKEEWKRQYSDVMRHAGAEMLRATLLICGGYDHLRQFSAELHAANYYQHHDDAGKVT